MEDGVDRVDKVDKDFVSQFITLGALVFTAGILLVGCERDVLSDAESRAAAFDFDGVLQLLRDVHDAEDRATSLKARALLVEGRTGEAFRLLAPDSTVTVERKYAGAKVIFAAVEVIIRETARAGEAAALLDSVIVWDPSLREGALKLAWDRALEYFETPGDAGWRLMRFIAANDRAALGRLRARDERFMKRYQEFEALGAVMDGIETGVRAFFAARKRSPVNMVEFSASQMGNGIAMEREGWVISLQPDLEGGVTLLRAEALKSNIGEMLPGTVTMRRIGAAVK